MTQGFTNGISLPLAVNKGGTGVTTSLGSGSVLLGTLPAITQITAQVFNSTGAFTYTPTTGMKYIRVRMVGAGGGSGAAQGTVGQTAASASGNAAGYLEFYMTAAQIGASKTGSIGTGGIAGTTPSGSGGTGGNTTFADWTAIGGVGGNGQTSSASSQVNAPPASANNIAGTGTSIINKGSITGGYSWTTTTSAAYGGFGGSNVFGQGGGTVAQVSAGFAAGFGGQSRGSGAGGSVAVNTGTSAAGNSGGNGAVYIEEYLSV